jgi:hypothetical protein
VDPALERECNDAWGHLPWVEVFIADGRFPAPTAKWVEAIESEYTDQNLMLSALDCYDWLQTSTAGKNRTQFQRTYGNWLKNNRTNPPPSKREEPSELRQTPDNKYLRQKAHMG